MFWTRALDAGSVRFTPGHGSARLQAVLGMSDYFDLANAVFHAGRPPLAAETEVDIHWRDAGEHAHVDNPDDGFTADYRSATAEVVWSATNREGYRFSTEGSHDVTVSHAFTALLRSGRFA